MRFELIDRITELERGKRLVAVKAITLAEEYLADHFPSFPVLPGVLMLQALSEAGAWLVREALDFRPSIILLCEARNVTYKGFVQPGKMLILEVLCRSLENGASEFSGVGSCEGTEVLRARFSLMHFSLSSRDESLAGVDENIVKRNRARFSLLHQS